MRVHSFQDLLPIAMLIVAANGCGSSVVRPDPSSVPPASVRSRSLPVTSVSAPSGGTALEDLPTVPATSIVKAGSEAEAVYHEVRRGESLSSIGRRYAMTAERLREANGLDPGAVLQPGQLLFVPRAPATGR